MSQLILATKESNIDVSLFRNSLSNKTDFIMDSAIIRKPDAETPGCGFVHPIPYCIVSYKDKILSYQRTSMSGENRLHGLYSVGIGGHIDLEEESEVFSKSTEEFIKETAFREFEEELMIDASQIVNFEVLSTLYDTTTEVNKLHLGYICKLEISEDAYNMLLNPEHIVEDHICNISFEQEDIEKYESWSQIILKNFF